MLGDPIFVYPRVLEQEMLDTIEYSHVRPYSWSQMYSGHLRCI